MAGGSGERFWPLSRKEKPKQLLALGRSESSMLSEAVSRVENIIPKENIFIITSEILTPIIRESLTEIPPENVIPEPAKRNTAPALALATSFIIKKFQGKASPDQICSAILTADHIMEPESEFEKNVEAALSFVAKNNSIATIGIPPSRPETGYGYLELDQIISDDGVKINKLNSFKEKPDLETAKEYVAKGNYLWNSGMFFWRADHFISQMEKYLPEVGNEINYMSQNLGKFVNLAGMHLEPIAGSFESMPDISIDYGLMEKADSIVCLNATFSWDDVGDLNSVERTKTADDNGNITIGKNSILECNNSIFINNSSKSILTSISMKDVVVVLTDDSVLVTPKSDVQKVKQIVADLKEKGLQEWL